MRDTLLQTGKRFYELYGFHNKGIIAILNWWGDGEQILINYITALEEKERLEREAKEKLEKDRLDKI